MRRTREVEGKTIKTLSVLIRRDGPVVLFPRARKEIENIITSGGNFQLRAPINYDARYYAYAADVVARCHRGDPGSELNIRDVEFSPGSVSIFSSILTEKTSGVRTYRVRRLFRLFFFRSDRFFVGISSLTLPPCHAGKTCTE